MTTERIIEFIDGVGHYFTNFQWWQRKAWLNQGNNKITELRAILQRESQNS